MKTKCSCGEAVTDVAVRIGGRSIRFCGLSCAIAFLEDPLEPEVRGMLVGLRAKLEELFGEMAKRLEGLTREDDPAEKLLVPLREAVFGTSADARR